MERTELDVLMEQLDELLSGGVDDAEDALELASLAGTAARLGADPAWLADAENWKVGPGEELLETAWNLIDLAPLVEAIDAVSCGAETDEEVEEAVFDFDDIVAAAVWCGREDVVAAAAREVEGIISTLPDLFAEMAPYGVDLCRRRAVIDHVEVYGYWLAIAGAS